MVNRAIISGGGTGGHIFPAIAIANELRAQNPNVKILFVGALGKMEMERVPAAGYEIVGLPIAGLQRKLTAKNLLLPFKLLNSLRMARKVVKDFKPEVVIGVGGYASGPTLKMAQSLKIPTVVQEQNSYPGKTNRLLAKNVAAVCTAYSGLEDVFPKDRTHLTGNPVRKELMQLTMSKAEAFTHFPDLNPDRSVILVIGGSGGARTLNESVLHSLEHYESENVQVLWQCGRFYKEAMQNEMAKREAAPVVLTDFISRMDAAYTIADVIISRAGALSISELCLVGKPAIFVPSPNVSEDHQTKNAAALVKNKAAILVKDIEAKKKVMQTAFDLLKNEEQCGELGDNIRAMAKPDATEDIVKVINAVKI